MRLAGPSTQYVHSGRRCVDFEDPGMAVQQQVLEVSPANLGNAALPLASFIIQLTGFLVFLAAQVHRKCGLRVALDGPRFTFEHADEMQRVSLHAQCRNW